MQAVESAVVPAAAQQVPSVPLPALDAPPAQLPSAEGPLAAAVLAAGQLDPVVLQQVLQLLGDPGGADADVRDGRVLLAGQPSAFPIAAQHLVRLSPSSAGGSAVLPPSRPRRAAKSAQGVRSPHSGRTPATLRRSQTCETGCAHAPAVPSWKLQGFRHCL